MIQKSDKELLEILEYTKECAENYVPISLTSVINSIESICDGKYTAKIADIGAGVEAIAISDTSEHICNIWLRDRKGMTAYAYRLYVMYPGVYIYDITGECNRKLMSRAHKDFIENFFN